jgi:predicted nucleotidyltransferase
MEKISIKEIFFNHPSKEWHFEQVLKTSGLSRGQTNEWLKRLCKNEIILRNKPKKKMPHYVSNFNNFKYRNAKLMYALNSLNESGLLDYLTSLENVQTVVLFGSYSRWDWYNESDIDIFIYGNVKEIFVGKFSATLKKNVQLFIAKSEKDLKKMGSLLLRNILKGIILKGNINDILKNATIQNNK